MKNPKYIISFLLVMSFGLKIVLLSSDYIDASSVAATDKYLIDAFYTFVTLLTFVSILTVLFIFEDKFWAFFISALCGIFYFLIYAMDLSSMLPLSSSHITGNIIMIETLGLLASILLIIFSLFSVLKHVKLKSTQA